MSLEHGVQPPIVPPHVPTSVALARLVENTPEDRVSLEWLISQLGERSFGVLMLLMAFLGLAPGIATLAALLLPFPAVQMILGRERPSLPRFLAVRSIPAHRFSQWTNWVIPLFRRMEMFIRPRWHTPIKATKRFVGFIALLLAIALFAPFPLNIVPTLVIMLISFAYLEEDGMLLCIALVTSMVVLAGLVALIWETVGAARWLVG